MVRNTLTRRSNARAWATRTRLLLLLVLLGIVAVLPAAVISPTSATPPAVPTFLQNWAFDVRLLAGVPAKSVQSLLNGSPAAKQVYWDQSGETVRFTSGGVGIVGTLYTPFSTPPQTTIPSQTTMTAATVSYPGIILLHGSTPVGRKMGLYRVMGRELAARGYVVLAIDLRGYGDSGDPPDLQQAKSFDFVADVSHAVDFLLRRPEVNPDHLFVVGHSFGGDVAISAAVVDPRLQKIVAIGPGRRFGERGGDADAPEFDYFRRREMRYMLLRKAIPAEIFLAYRTHLPLESQMDYFMQMHQPILLIDGALESAADQAFLQTLYTMISEPKAYLTLSNADHYVNTANLGRIVVYDQQAVEQLIEEIDLWLEES